MKIALLLTGNELMSGDTVDSNSSMIAQLLDPIGFEINHKVTVGDDLDLLVLELDKLSQQYDVVIVNGGLGPTVDDLTAIALAKLIGKNLVKNQQAFEHVHEWCAARGIEANEANLKQAMLPIGASVLANPVGSAVGIQLQYRQCLLLCTPGVPSELRAMLNGSVAEALKSSYPNASSKYVRRLKLFGMGESGLQQLLDDECSDWPAEVIVGFRAGAPLLELKLEVSDKKHLGYRDDCEKRLRELVGDFIVGENDETLSSVVVDLLAEKGRMLTLAESCTGGLIASQITEVSGASKVFEAGFVTYSNTIKENVLAVDHEVLEQYGAVSQEVVHAMASGALLAAGADCVIAVSGIAGPEGGTIEKPVGTVWVAWGEEDSIMTHRFNYPVERKFFQLMISSVALDLLRRYLLGETNVPGYFQRESR